ncbi:MAG: alkyl hydroperoxide reductase subunit F [Alphaproteobacteria bacterium]|jgi:alkyl hydroperoxide reductase subunit F|nr:alkyl hydroperoxide reductase subunit F [Alphaproteobacteria bacterium]
MSLDEESKAQLIPYLDYIEQNIVLKVYSDAKTQNVLDFVEEIAALSPKISVEKAILERIGSFSIDKTNESSGIVFAGLPLGHEFTSFVMALLQVSGRPPKIAESLIAQIKKIDKKLNFTTYVSLTCHNCPDVVQALNIMAVLNHDISHTMVEGGSFVEEVESKQIMAVPTVFCNGEEFSGGRITLEQILAKLGSGIDNSELNNKEPYDMLVVGGGPAGSAAAIYASRKGIRTGLLAENLGGQVLETLGIENIIGTKYTEGAKFMSEVLAHIQEYPIDIITTQIASKLEKKEFLELSLQSGVVLKAKSIVLATGAKWKSLGIKGEAEFKNKGIAYCPHCDGPLFAGKDIAVIGGGNSGVEAAIDLAGMAKHIYLLEFASTLKADKILQERLQALSNVSVITNAQTAEIAGSAKVENLKYLDRISNQEKTLSVQGVFILIGLTPNTAWLGDSITKNKFGEIIVDKHGSTNMEGVFAAGDCTDSVYKQIVISMGSGATSSLGAFDYLIRNYDR